MSDVEHLRNIITFARPDNSVALGIHIKSLGGGGIMRYLGIALKYFARKKLIKRDKR